MNVPYSSLLNQSKLKRLFCFGSIPGELDTALDWLPFGISSSGRSGGPSSLTGSPFGRTMVFSDLAAWRFLMSGSCGQLGAGERSVAIGGGRLRFGGTTSGERSL